MHFIAILFALLLAAYVASKYGYAGLFENALTTVSVGIIGTAIGSVAWVPIVFFTSLPFVTLGYILCALIVVGWIIAYVLVKLSDA